MLTVPQLKETRYLQLTKLLLSSSEYKPSLIMSISIWSFTLTFKNKNICSNILTAYINKQKKCHTWHIHRDKHYFQFSFFLLFPPPLIFN